MQILRISIYVEPDDIPNVSFGKMATVFPGKAPLVNILEGEVKERRAGSKTVIASKYFSDFSKSHRVS